MASRFQPLNVMIANERLTTLLRQTPSGLRHRLHPSNFNSRSFHCISNGEDPNQKRSLGNALSVLISCLLFVRETHASRCFAVGAGRARLHGQCSIRSRRYLRYCDQGCISHTGSCKLSPRCEPTSEERSAGNPHATFHGSRRRVTASGDPVLGGVTLRGDQTTDLAATLNRRRTRAETPAARYLSRRP